MPQARRVFGEQDWSTWGWSAHEYGTSEPRVIPFLWKRGSWFRSAPSVPEAVP